MTNWMKIAVALVGVAAVFVAGYHAAAVRYERDIAEMMEEYAERETDALRKAEALRDAQEERLLAEIEALKRDAVERTADAERVRQQFSQLKSSRSATIEQCNRRAGRCEQLLSEAYELAGEGEGLLKDRDARLRSLSVKTEKSYE